MSDKITNTQDRPEEKPLTEQELQFCNLYVNGGLEYAGRPKKCFVEVFGEDTVKNPYASANYLMNKPHVLAHIKALLSSERFEMETMAVKLQVTETLKAIMTRRPLRTIQTVSVCRSLRHRSGPCRSMPPRR